MSYTSDTSTKVSYLSPKMSMTKFVHLVQKYDPRESANWVRHRVFDNSSNKEEREILEQHPGHMVIMTQDKESRKWTITKLIDISKEEFPKKEKKKPTIETKKESPQVERSLASVRISAMNQLPQAQYGLNDQLKELLQAANRLGLYDAADFLKNHIKQ